MGHRSRLVSAVLILCADTPLIDMEVIIQLIQFKRENNLQAAGLSFVTEDPTGYGRIKRSNGQIGVKIVEQKDATENEKEISEVNSGIYLVDLNYLKDKASKLKSNNEYYYIYLHIYTCLILYYVFFLFYTDNPQYKYLVY